MKQLIIGSLSLLLASVSVAQPATDWKLIGGGSNTYLLYDSAGLRKLENGHFEVWLKGLPKTSVDKAKLSKDGIARAANKVASGYQPPALAHKASVDEMVNGAFIEEVADEAMVDPNMRMLIEIDCTNGLSRFLSLYTKQGGKTSTSDTTGAWEHIAPETNSSALQTALCPAK